MVAPGPSVKGPVVKNAENTGLRNVKPVRDPKLNVDVVVPDPVWVTAPLFVSVMLPLMPPLTAIEMSETVWPPRLNCAHAKVVLNSVGPLTEQLSIKVLAEASPLKTTAGRAAKQALTTRFIHPPKGYSYRRKDIRYL